MEQTTTQSFLKRIHFFKRIRFYVWKDVHLFMNIIVNDEKVKFKHIVFLSCFMYCWFKKKQKIPQITYKIIFTLSPRKLSVSILQNLLWLFRWLYGVSQKKIALKFSTLDPFKYFGHFGLFLIILDKLHRFWHFRTFIVSLLQYFPEDCCQEKRICFGSQQLFEAHRQSGIRDFQNRISLPRSDWISKTCTRKK